MSWLIPRFAVIPTNGRACLDEAVEAILPQVDLVLLIRTSEDNWNWRKRPPPKIINIASERSRELNISHWWNLGLDYAETKAGMQYADSPAQPPATKWDVAVINDDCIVPEGWFDAVSGTMRQLQVAAGCSGGAGYPILHTQPGPVNLATRMQGFAFMLAGEKGIRADERLHWWCGDDDLDWESRRLGGMVMVPGYHVNHLFPNGQMTPELQVQVARDLQTFVDKWGRRPW